MQSLYRAKLGILSHPPSARGRQRYSLALPNFFLSFLLGVSLPRLFFASNSLAANPAVLAQLGTLVLNRFEVLVLHTQSSHAGAWGPLPDSWPNMPLSLLDALNVTPSWLTFCAWAWGPHQTRVRNALLSSEPRDPRRLNPADGPTPTDSHSQPQSETRRDQAPNWTRPAKRLMLLPRGAHHISSTSSSTCSTSIPSTSSTLPPNHLIPIIPKIPQTPYQSNHFPLPFLHDLLISLRTCST